MGMSLEELQEYLSIPEALKRKTDAQKIFSFVRYKQGTTRGNENVSHVTAIVLDFDFKTPIKGTMSGYCDGIDYIQELIEASPFVKTKHFWYTTFSYRDEQPNFRLILPLASAEEMTPDEYKQALPQIIVSFDSHQPDTCAKALAQVYFGPAVNSHAIEKKFFHGSV